MKNTRIVSAVMAIVVAAGMVTPVLAKGRPADAGQKGQEKSQEHRSAVASKSAEFVQAIKDRISEARKNHLKRWWTDATKRLQKLVDRETKLADKIQARIDKLSAAGRDTTKVKADLATAKATIVVAQSALTSATGQIDSIVANNNPKDAFKKLHDLYNGVIAKIRDSHKALVKVLAETKGLSEDHETPTPTVSPTATPTPTATP